MDTLQVNVEQEETLVVEQGLQPKVPTLPADIVFSPELCDFLAQVMLRIAKEKKNAA